MEVTERLQVSVLLQLTNEPKAPIDQDDEGITVLCLRILKM